MAEPRIRSASASRSLAVLPVIPPEDPRWTLVEEGFQIAREHEIESLFAITNGHVGTRGALAEGSSHSSPATFVAGLFDWLAGSGATPALLPAPDWLGLSGSVDGRLIRLEDDGVALEHRRILDLRHGLLWRVWRHRDATGRVTRVVGMRLASLADRHLLVQVVTLTPENYCGRVRLEAALSGGTPVENAPLPVLVGRTSRGQTVAIASRTRLRTPAGLASPEATVFADRVIERWEFAVEIGQVYRFNRVAAVFSSLDRPDPVAAAIGHVKALRSGTETLIQDQLQAWDARWKRADIEVAGSDQATRALRFAVYHLTSAADPENDRVSIPARGLTGPAYRGHVFWDTDVFMQPFFEYTQPAVARALVMYRYHSLPAARERAAKRGYRGALFAWESTDLGEDATPPYVVAPDGEVVMIASGEQENHVSAAVAHAAWSYWQVTRDEEFLIRAGAEILLETARFWASRGSLEGDGLFHIRHVMGPDEYHEDVDDNAYTNGMARWNLERGAEVARILRDRWPETWRELAKRLEVAWAEVEEWSRLAQAMYSGFSAQTGLFEQFRGFFDLEDCDPAEFRGKAAPPDVILGRERVRRLQIIKQADVLMLLWLLWDRFDRGIIAANFDYYEPRTAHGSSLSPAIHAALAARLGHVPAAVRLFDQAAEVDLANNMGNAAGGVHLGAMGGLWQAAVLGFAGMEPRSGGVEFDPHVPDAWKSLRFRMGWRGRSLDVKAGAEPRSLEVRLLAGDPLIIRVRGGPETRLHTGRSAQLQAGAAGWPDWEEQQS